MVFNMIGMFIHPAVNFENYFEYVEYLDGLKGPNGARSESGNGMWLKVICYFDLRF